MSLVLRGPPGVGKSALLDWTVAQASDRTVLRARGALRDMYEPFSVLESLLQHQTSGLQAAMIRNQSALTAQLGDGGLPVDRFKVAMVLFGLLSSLAESQPVLVVVDDARRARDHININDHHPAYTRQRAIHISECDWSRASADGEPLDGFEGMEGLQEVSGGARDGRTRPIGRSS
jgi:hypothetical protein